MRVLLRALLGLLGLTLVSSVLVSAPAATAAPTPAPASHLQRSSSGATGVDLSSTQWKAAKYAAKARNKAINAGGSTMNYSQMKSVYKDAGKYRTSWRRQLAAGFRQAGGKITHISNAESKKVNALRKQIYDGSGDRVARPTDGARSSCKGKSGKVVVNSKETHTYFNSCQTIDLKYYWGGCAAAMGFLGKFVSKDPRVDIPAYFIASGCGLVAGDISRQAAKSDVGAIYLKTYKQESYAPYSGGTRYFIQTTIEPQ